MTSGQKRERSGSQVPQFSRGVGAHHVLDRASESGYGCCDEAGEQANEKGGDGLGNGEVGADDAAGDEHHAGVGDGRRDPEGHDGGQGYAAAEKGGDEGQDAKAAYRGDCADQAGDKYGRSKEAMSQGGRTPRPHTGVIAPIKLAINMERSVPPLSKERARSAQLPDGRVRAPASREAMARTGRILEDAPIVPTFQDEHVGVGVGGEGAGDERGRVTDGARSQTGGQEGGPRRWGVSLRRRSREGLATTRRWP